MAQRFDQELDVRGLLCPLPVIKTRFALEALAAGEVLRVRATDPGSQRDLEAFARHTGHRLLGASAEDGEYVYYLEKA